ncbi:MAG: hypothetical protein WC864_01185 [Ilumatobacteraceae bacterium]
MTGVLVVVGVLGIAFWLLGPTMVVHAMTAVAVHDQHSQEECNP